MEQCRLYEKLDRFSLFNYFFAFFDTSDYLADGLFIKHQVPVQFGGEFSHPDCPYLLIMCRVRKRDVDRFQAALDELPNKMLLCGHTDYIDACRTMWGRLRKAVQKGGEQNGTDGTDE